MRRRAKAFLETMRTRRSVRHFSSEPVPLEVVEIAIAAAATAPSGANQQPWRFALVADPEIQCRMREAAEAEERENDERRFPGQWLQAREPVGADGRKEFLETAAYGFAGGGVRRTCS